MKKILTAPQQNRKLKWKRKRHTYWLEHLNRQHVVFDIQNKVILKQLEMIDLTVEDLKVAKAIQPLIIKHIDQIVTTFYDSVTSVEHLRNIILTHSAIERLRVTLKTHLVEMFNGQLDQEFLEKRVKIAKIHYRIGLESKWYMGAFQNLQNELLHIVRQYVTDRDENLRISETITKILSFEQQLVLEAYERKNLRSRQKEHDKIKNELKEKIISVCEAMAQITERTALTVQKLAQNSDLVNESVLKGADTSRQTERLAKDGQVKLIELKTSIEAIYSRANQLKEMVGKLNHFFTEISEVIGLVQSIADQTNLLSLNSSIEAARAGEYGAGFSVVSEEIRKLANQTKESAEQITNYINETENFTKGFVRVIGEVSEFVQEGKYESDAAHQTFHHILDSMMANIDEIVVVEQGMSGLIDNINEIKHAMEEVSASADTLYTSVEKL